jgi:hypothetical protein
MDEGSALPAQWRWTEFIQHEEEVGKPIRHVQSKVPLATPAGIRYAPGGPDYYARESVSAGPPPLDQLVDFLNKYGDEILDWKIVDGSNGSSRLRLIYKDQGWEVAESSTVAAGRLEWQRSGEAGANDHAGAA